MAKRSRDGSGAEGTQKGKEDGRKSRKGKKDKLKLMEGQTREQRREIRRQQKVVREEIIGRREDIGNIQSDALEEMAKKNDTIFEQVKFAREAVNDVENVRLLASEATVQLKAINQGATSYNADDFIKAIKTKGTHNDAFGWRTLGYAVGVMFNGIHSGGQGFLMGPLDQPQKAKKARSVRTKHKDDTEEVVPETVNEQAGPGTAKKKDQTEARIGTLKKLVEGDCRPSSDFLETLVNPSSFTETVENIFDYSFLIKNGKGFLELDKDTGMLKMGPAAPSQEGVMAPRQSVLSLNMAEWREIVDAWGITEPKIKRRGPRGYFDPLAEGGGGRASA